MNIGKWRKTTKLYFNIYIILTCPTSFNWLQDISTPNFSTPFFIPDILTIALQTQTFQPSVVKSPWLNLWVKKSGVEMSCNLSKRRCWFEIHQKIGQWQIFPLLLFSLTNENWLLQFCPAMSKYLLKLKTPEPGKISYFL